MTVIDNIVAVVCRVSALLKILLKSEIDFNLCLKLLNLYEKLWKKGYKTHLLRFMPPLSLTLLVQQREKFHW